MTGSVVAVSFSPLHSFTKPTALEILLRAGLGVAGDVHCGATVRDSYSLMKDPTLPNLRQVHLLHEELHDALRAAGFHVGPGIMGENITTRGIELLDLPTGACLHIGTSAVVELTGLRTPCSQLDAYQKGLKAAVLERMPDGAVIRKSGVMAIVVTDGWVRPGDVIRVELPPEPWLPLAPV